MRLRGKLILLSVIASLAGIILLPFLFPFPRDCLSRLPSSAAIYDREGNLLRLTLGEGETLSRPVPLSAMGDWSSRAVIAAEDKRFFRHPGIDPIAVGRAALQNLSSRRIVSGASTISTLVVKLLHPPSSRNYLTKLREAFQALQLETAAGKETILEQYLNRAPFGGNLVGIEAASLFYFGKPARDLSLSEAALLVGLPKSPRRLRPDRAEPRAVRRRNSILEKMAAEGMIGAETGKAAAKDPSGAAARGFPFRASHFCDYVLSVYPREKTLRTTLDPRLQETVEDCLRRESDRLRGRGVSGGAAVVIHVPSGEVRALVGSPNYREKDSGQVNCALARRSPGSALKPFIYALAFDRGVVAPGTVVPDIPLSFSDWRPQNFSRRFAGLVTVRDALVRSLNIPALELARRLGADAVLESLRNLGLKTLDRNARDYGLGIAVGTCEVTLLDLTNAYAALARGGRYLPLRILTTETSPAPERIVSEAAAYLVSDILSGEERSLLLSGHAADALLPRFAFKTGTSNGQRDAWTVAYNPEYAVGIWFGNPRGRSSPALTGGETAAPLAGEIFRRLYPEGAGPWFEEPGNVLPQKICSRSGLPPNPCCPATGEDLAIAGVSPLYPCRVHRAAADDRPDSRVEEIWPGEIMSYLEKNGLSARGEPTAAGAARRKLAITSPAAAQTFSLIEDLPAVPQGLSLAAAAAGAKRYFWFVDGELFAEADPSGACFWPLRPGRHAISCSDEEGNSDRVEITVE